MSAAQQAAVVAALPAGVPPLVLVSCTTQAGWDAFLARMSENLSLLCGLDSAQDTPAITHARHRAHVQHTLDALDAALVR